MQDLDAILLLAAATPGAPQWPRSVYQSILSPDPGLILQRSCLAAFTELPEGRVLTGTAVVSLSPIENLAELETILVHSAFRRRGIGAGLLRRAIEIAKQDRAELLRLEVRASNAAALAFYRRQGFRETGRRGRYYTNPADDALLFEMPLH